VIQDESIELVSKIDIHQDIVQIISIGHVSEGGNDPRSMVWMVDSQLLNPRTVAAGENQQVLTTVT